MPRFRLSALVLLVCLTAVGGVACAGEIVVGAARVEVPEPTGFVAAGETLPELKLLSQNYLPEASRLLEIYLEPGDFEKMKAGEEAQMLRYSQLVVAKSLERIRVTPAEFAAGLPTMRSAIESTLPGIEAEGDRLAAKGNASLQEMIGADAEVSVDDVKSHGFFREEPWGLFFAVSSNVTLTMDGETETSRQVGAAALALVGEKILFFYTYRDESEPDAARLARESLSRWVDATRAASASTAP